MLPRRSLSATRSQCSRWCYHKMQAYNFLRAWQDSPNFKCNCSTLSRYLLKTPYSMFSTVNTSVILEFYKQTTKALGGGRLFCNYFISGRHMSSKSFCVTELDFFAPTRCICIHTLEIMETMLCSWYLKPEQLLMMVAFYAFSRIQTSEMTGATEFTTVLLAVEYAGEN